MGTIIHHLVHVAFVGAAVVVFIAFVAVEVRRRGWPTFSWRVKPSRRAERFGPRG